MDTPNPAQAADLHGERVQPDGPLSGEVKREGAPRAPSARYRKHLAAQRKASAAPAKVVVRQVETKRDKPARVVARPRPSKLRGWDVVPIVYFVRARSLGLIKIGLTVDLNDRLKTLQVGSPDLLEIVGAIRAEDAPHREQMLHARFSRQWSHGEWFHPSNDLLALIAEWPVSIMHQQEEDDLRAALQLTYGGKP